MLNLGISLLGELGSLVEFAFKLGLSLARRNKYDGEKCGKHRSASHLVGSEGEFIETRSQSRLRRGIRRVSTYLDVSRCAIR